MAPSEQHHLPHPHLPHSHAGELHLGSRVPPEVHRRRWEILAVLCLSLMVIIMDNTILNVALPKLAEDLQAGSSQLQWFVDAYTIVFAGLLLSFGALGDKFGRRRALLIGLVLFAAGSIASAFSNTPGQLIGSRAFMGIGGALIMPATLSILTNVFENPQERAKAISIWAAVSGIGVVAGPVLGGFLLEHYHWGAVFLINIPLLAIAVSAVWAIVPESKDDLAPRLDVPGAVLSIAGISGLLWGIIEAPSRGWTHPDVLIGFGVSTVILVLFAFWELRTKDPMLDIRFFENPRFSAANAAVTLTFFGMFGSIFLLTQWLQLVKGYSSLAAGVRTIPFALGMAIAAPASAVLVKRFGTKLVVSAGLFIVCGALLSMTTVHATSSYTQVMISIVIMSMGMGLTMPPATESVMGSLPPEKAGVGSAMNDTTREFGGAFGVAVIGSMVFSAYRDQLAPMSKTLPADAAALADKGLAQALMVAQNLAAQAGPEKAKALADAAKVAFSEALHRGFVVGAIATLLGAIAALVFLPATASETTAWDTPSPAGLGADPELVGA